MSRQTYTTGEWNTELQIQIRFNTSYPEHSPFKWRIIIDGKQCFCDSIHSMCPTFTSTDIVEEDGTGRRIEKHHISCVAKEVTIEKENGFTIAKII